MQSSERLRVALLAGSLYQGGAEKQLIYIARALLERHVDLRVYTLTQGEFYEARLKAIGVEPVWIGRYGNPLIRALVLARHLRAFRPHVLQASQFFVNLHVSIAGRLTGTPAVGAVRGDPAQEMETVGIWARCSMRLPPDILANSHSGRTKAIAHRGDPRRVHVLPNVIDLRAFDGAEMPNPADMPARRPLAAVVCRLVAPKRVDRFLAALRAAREECGDLCGVIVGDGPERSDLQSRARTLGLLPNHLCFLGRRDDVPALLKAVDFLVVSSDHEGFTNIVLEGMAARLPVVTTPAGDAPRVVVDGETGYVVPFDDVGQMAERMSRLGNSPSLRRRLGDAGRTRVERHYGFDTLGDRLFSLYRAVAEHHKRGDIDQILSRSEECVPLG